MCVHSPPPRWGQCHLWGNAQLPGPLGADSAVASLGKQPWGRTIAGASSFLLLHPPGAAGMRMDRRTDQLGQTQRRPRHRGKSCRGRFWPHLPQAQKHVGANCWAIAIERSGLRAGRGDMESLAGEQGCKRGGQRRGWGKVRLGGEGAGRSRLGRRVSSHNLFPFTLKSDGSRCQALPGGSSSPLKLELV